MIAFNGYEEIIKKTYGSGQDHVFRHWGELNETEKKQLLDDLSEIDFDALKALFSKKQSHADIDFGPAPYIHLPSGAAEEKERDMAAEAGRNHIRGGGSAAFMVAGGQGSRLGFEGPKGKFRIAPVSGKSLFQIHAEKIFKYSEKYGVEIPLLIMTSRANHGETCDFFAENSYFGLSPSSVKIFPQNMIPSLDSAGKLILETNHGVFKNPDGHGGSLTALQTSGSLDFLEKKGVKTISYFQVDNPLAKIIDPVFIGYHILKGAEISSKAIRKAYPEEKVGVFVEFSNGRVGVVEYSDLPREKTFMKEGDDLVYSSANIAIHLFDSSFVKRLTSGGGVSLPFHVAKKKIRSYTECGYLEVDGLKYEKFVFDALPLTEKNVVFETVREEEFAPVKNASGVDSVESARALMSSLFRKWLESRGIAVPGQAREIEISPLLAVDPEDLSGPFRIDGVEKIYIDRS